MAEMAEESATSPVHVRFGDAFAIVGPTTRAVLSRSNGDLAEDLWHLIADGGGVDDLLEALSGTGLKALGSFAIAEHEGAETRFLVRGQGVVEFDRGNGKELFGAGSARTWLESLHSNVLGYSVCVGVPHGDAEVPFRISGGLVPADLVCWGSMSRRAPVSEIDIDEAGDVSSSLPGLSVKPRAWEPAIEMLESTAEGEAADGPSPSSAGVEASRSTGVDSATRLPTAGATVFVGQPRFSEPPDAMVPDDDGDGDYDEYVSGLTRTSPASDAGVVFDAEGSPMPVARSETAGDRPQSPALPAPTPPSPIESPTPAGGVISGVPGAHLSASSGRQPQGSGDHDGHTMSLAQLRALRGQSGTAPVADQPAMGGATVNALICPTGHPSPPHAGVCRSCGVPVSGSPVLVARPKLGRLSLSTGEVVDLDRPVLIGRIPKVEGELRGAVPHTVALPDFAGVSRRHVMVHLEQWQVLIEDLGSQNGTEVTLPGRTPQRLRERDPIPLTNGTIVDLAGEVTINVELV